MSNPVYLGLALCVVTMALLWAVQLRTRNAGIVDIGWAALVALLAVLAVVPAGDAPPIRRFLPPALAVLWGARLILLIHRRGHGKPEEGRYRALREHWGDAARVKFFFFFQFQAVAALLFSLPYTLTMLAGPSPFGPVEWIAVALWLAAFSGEATADAQLAAFKRDPGNRGRVCDVGLWRYSRHPNYFFEWLIWVAAALMALPAPGGWIALACPVSMLFFLLRVTGIPATEAQALRSRGEAYRRYQRTTSMFVPLPPRKVAE